MRSSIKHRHEEATETKRAVHVGLQWKWDAEECRKGGCCPVAFLESLQLIKEQQIQGRKDAEVLSLLRCDPPCPQQWMACACVRACVSLYAVPVLCGRQVGGTNFLKCTCAASPALIVQRSRKAGSVMRSQQLCFL